MKMRRKNQFNFTQALTDSVKILTHNNAVTLINNNVMDPMWKLMS